MSKHSVDYLRLRAVLVAVLQTCPFCRVGECRADAHRILKEAARIEEYEVRHEWRRKPATEPTEPARTNEPGTGADCS